MAEDVSIVIGGNASGAVAAANQASNAMSDLGSTASHSAGHFDLLRAALGPLGGMLEQVAGRARMVLETMILWRGFDFIQNQIQGITSSLFELNNTMEKTQVSWQYLFGTGDNAASVQMAQDLADWTKKQSYNYPFTRQDMLGAINAAGMSTNDPNLIKEYLPTIADIASTRTNFAGQPVTLQQAMYALSMANEGMSRMLKYDLKITPDDLKQYGWDEGSHDFNNLLTALKAYNEAHHLQGAAQHIATTTWFGEKSSFEDRLQNMELLIGHHMFEELKGDLESFTQWWDAHQATLDKIGTWFGDVIAGGVKGAGSAVKDFITGAYYGTTGVTHTASGMDDRSKTGLAAGTNPMEAASALSTIGALGEVAHGAFGDVLAFIKGIIQDGPIATEVFVDPLQRLAAALSSSGTKEFFSLLGQLLGTLQSTVVVVAITTLQSFFDAVGKSGAGDALLGLVGSLKDFIVTAAPFLTQIGDLLGTIVGMGVGNVLSVAATTLHDIVQGAKDFMNSGFGQWIQGQLLVGLKDLKNAMTDFKNSMTPEEWNALTTAVKFLGAALLLLPLGAIILLVKTLTVTLQGLIIFHDVGVWVGSAGVNFAALATQMLYVQNATHNVTDAFTNLGAWLAKIFTTWIIQARTWGRDLIWNLAAGIVEGVDHLKDALGVVGRAITGQLGHSVPSEGPLKDELTWMPHMMTNLASGILTNVPLVASASQTAAAAIAAPFTVGGSGGGGGGSVSYGASTLNMPIYANSQAQVQQLITAALAARNAATAQAALVPGAFTRFGDRGR